MAKDYAKQHSRKKNSFIAQGAFKRLLVVGAVTALSAGCFYVYHNEGEALLAWAKQSKAFFQHTHAGLPQKKPVIVAKTEPELHFDFYTELPNMHMPHPPKAHAPTAPPQDYFLQLGLYKNRSDASEQRVSLLLLGLEADIVKTSQGYALQQGLFTSLEEAQTMQNRLKKKGIESTIKKA